MKYFDKPDATQSVLLLSSSSSSSSSSSQRAEAQNKTFSTLYGSDIGGAPSVEYVCGFMFYNGQVALIQKTKPAWQKGRLNGIGGKIEPGEDAKNAMVREFEEETGVITSNSSWRKLLVLDGIDDSLERYRVHFYRTTADRETFNALRSKTEEEVRCVRIDFPNVFNSIPNLAWIVPMANTIAFDFSAESFYMREEYNPPRVKRNANQEINMRIQQNAHEQELERVLPAIPVHNFVTSYQKNICFTCKSTFDEGNHFPKPLPAYERPVDV